MAPEASCVAPMSRRPIDSILRQGVAITMRALLWPQRDRREAVIAGVDKNTISATVLRPGTTVVIAKSLY